jgi:DNA polymerase-1
MRDVALEEIKEYAAEDADVTFQLKELFAVELEKTQTSKLFEDIEILLYPFSSNGNRRNQPRCASS